MRTKRKFPTVFSVLAVLGMFCTPLHAQTEVFPVDHEFYPYYPSLIKWNKSSVDFTAPETCGECHPEQYAEWQGSVHSLAFQDPIYQGELNKAVKAVGHNISRQCEGCHSPAGMVTGEISKPGLEGLSPMAGAGVSCDICHSISDITHWRTPTHEPENGSFVLTPGLETLQGPKRIKRGPNPPADGCGEDFHDCRQSPLHLRAELCASCHQVYHYDKHFPLEATYLEWKHGPYAQREILCQDCHMVDIKTFKKTADSLRKPQIERYRHYFNGANYLLYHLAGAAAEKSGDLELATSVAEKYQMAVQRLQAAADLELHPVYRQGKLAEIMIRVKNIRAGHNLPTSLTNVRQMWLELKASDGKGNVLLQTGGINEQGQLSADTRVFNSEGMGNDFHFAIDPWVVTAFSRHDTIPPKGYKDVYYGVSLPDDVKELVIEARLRYRQADQKVAEALLGAVPADMDLEKIYGLSQVPQLPVVDMVVKKEKLAAVGSGH